MEKDYGFLGLVCIGDNILNDYDGIAQSNKKIKVVGYPDPKL
jgi:hypothetical protein